MNTTFIPNDTTTEAIAQHVAQVLQHLGEDPEREGLQRTPERVGKAMQFLTQGYQQDPEAILRSALFEEDYRQMVVVTPCAALLRQSACGIYPQWQNNRTEQGGTRGGRIRTTTASARTHDNTNQRVYPEHPEPLRRNGSHRSRTPVHADARRTETRSSNYHQRLHRRIQPP